jgi:hypothetical protein
MDVRNNSLATRRAAMARARKSTADLDRDVWLRNALAAERASVVDFLERRHEELLRKAASIGLELSTVNGVCGSNADNSSRSRAPPTLLSKEAEVPLDNNAFTDADFATEFDDIPFSPSAELEPVPSPHTPVTPVSKKLSEVKKSLGVHSEEDDSAGMYWTARLVRHPLFEILVATVIMSNVCVMAAQIQYDGFDHGRNLEYRGYDVRKEDAWPHAETVFQVLDFMFGIIYCAELLLKMHALRCEWLRDCWNYFDLVIVICWLVETTFAGILTLPADATLLRTARLFKLLRLVKVIKTLQGFDSLYLLVTTLRGSFQILGWSCILLVAVQMLVAFTMWFLLTMTYFDNDYYPKDERREIFRYFGTFSRAMLSMFELTLANWPPICRALVETVNEWFMIFFVAHKLTMGFAVIGVINGVFMQETFKVASSDDSIMMRQRDRDVRIYGEKMSRLFQATDADSNGVVSIDEFGTVMQDPEIVKWMSTLEIPVRDHRDLFTLLDVDSNGVLTAEELVKGMLRLRGNAKSVDVISLKRFMLQQQKCLSDSIRAAQALNEELKELKKG